VQLAEELGVDQSTEFTPAVLANLVDARLRPRAAEVDLEVVRSLGRAFDRGCYARASIDIQCTFWLWHRDEMERGIQLNVRERTTKEDLRISAGYVYELAPR
jgi:hypothetical protein